MTAASVLGVAITPERAAACRELLAGVASRGAWALVEPLLGAAHQIDAQPVRGPEGAILTRAPMLVHALASCALGTACARCSAPIEDDHDPAAIREALAFDVSLPPLSGEELDDGWCCSTCAERQREIDAFRQRSAMWLRRGVQLGLFGAAPAKRRRKSRA